MIMRRRPLLRAAAVGGSAYLVGKRAGQRNADQQETESAQAGGASDQASQGGQARQPGPEAASASAASIPDQLNRLSALHDQGSLTDAEFASAKSKLLGT
jgi:Short C-terminal domain